MKYKIVALILSLPAPIAAVADAGNGLFTLANVSGEMGLGSLSGKTKERVYEPEAGGRKLSQLNWKYNNVPIVKGSLNWDLIPSVSIGASGWTTIASRGGYMDDTDWMNERKSEWTHQSWHPNTRLNYANESELNVKGWLLNEPAYRLGVVAGYQESRYSFHATGGSYHYTNQQTGLPDIGSFPYNESGIAYQQRYKTPYVGLTGSYRYKRFEFGGTFKYSGWVRTADNDEHYNTQTTYKDNIKNQSFYSLAGSAGYYVTPKAKVYLEGVWSRTTNKKGDTSAHDYGDGTTGYLANSSGIENYSFMTMVGLKYTF